MAWQNRIQIDGNNNASIQDISNSTITINFHRTEKSVLNVIVLSSSASRIAKLPNLPQGFSVNNHYNDKIHEWKPFNQQITIKDYLRNCTPQEISLCIDTTDSLKPVKDKNYWAYLNYVKYNTILIVDILALQFVENQEIARFFNDYHIGGCIVVSPYIDSNLEDTTKRVFEHLNIYITDGQFAGKLKTTHIVHIENVNKEHLLQNAIRNVAEYCLEYKRVGSQRFKSNYNDLGM
jgi:hypothetical protein